jgi:hypothetical protein
LKDDDFVKSPYAALRCILRHCGVRKSTPHSSGFARLASGAFYEVVPSLRRGRLLTRASRINHDFQETTKGKDLKFVGTKICYPFMQAVGMVKDHGVSRFRHEQVKKIHKRWARMLKKIIIF